jgi:hypothetical protein
VRLWRLVTGQRYGRQVDPLTRLQRQQLVLALRALDGHLAGATYREIAGVLFGAARVPTRRGERTTCVAGRSDSCVWD